MLADPAGTGPDGETRVKVWSPGVRILHWVLTAAFITAYSTGDEVMQVHFWTGHGILVVILVRALMGLYGSDQVRFETFVPTPGALLEYFRDLKNRTAKRTLGHDPAGGAMIATLLTILLLTVATGLGNYYMPALEEVLEELHEVLANIALFLVILHVVGVSVSSYLQGENLIGSMFTGWKRRGTDLATTQSPAYAPRE